MYELEKTMYHKVLRVALVVCAFVLLFESGIVSETTTQLSQNTHQYLANAVGVGASVQPNELNLLTAEVTKEKLALAEREALVSEREIAVAISSSENTSNDYVTYIMASILFILLVLIILNYILDYIHRREVMLAT